MTAIILNHRVSFRDLQIAKRFAVLNLPVSRIKQMRRSSTTRRLMNMWMTDPYCYWCDRLTVFPTNRLGGKQHRNWATVDHLKSRTMGRQKGENCPLVLACYTCNHQRNDLELKTLAGKPVCKSLVTKFSARGGFDLTPTALKP